MRTAALQDSPSPEVRQLADYYSGPAELAEYLHRTWVVVPDPVDLEYVRTPRRAVWEAKQLGAFQGDCDDATTLAASVLAAWGIPSDLVAIRMPGDYEYSHVFLRFSEPPYVIDPIAGGQIITDHEEEIVLPMLVDTGPAMW